MDAKLAADDRFYTPRSSARRGYTSGSSEDDRFVSPRESARSVSSDDNDYSTPRESLSTPSDAHVPATSAATMHSAKYLDDAFRGSKRFPAMNDMKETLPAPKAEHKSGQRESSAKGHYLGLATGGGGSSRHIATSARASDVRSLQYADTPPPVPENDIFSAARHNRVDSVTYMLDQGVSVNSKDEFGNSILSIACQNGLKRMAKLALRRGANINSKNVRLYVDC